MFREFREFAMCGNVLDMAVGIIIGAAFGRIVESIVKDLIMPPLGEIRVALTTSRTGGAVNPTVRS